MKKIDSLEKIQKEVELLIEDFGGYWAPLAMLASVMEEVGEAAREITNLEGIKPKKPTEPHGDLGSELADILFSVICLANHYEIDLSKKFAFILNKYRTRDSERY